MTAVAELDLKLRVAWNAASGEDFASRMARRSLEASARQVPELARTLFELQNSFQAELDVHLTGVGVRGHETDALKFADLVRGIADAVKEISKQAMGRQRLPSPLQIVAPVPASVRVLLRVAPPSEPDGTVPLTRTETQHSRSLAIVARILQEAGHDASPESESGSSLSALTTTLPSKAHAALKRAARAIEIADWNVDGILRRPADDPVSLHLDRTSARALLDLLEASETREDDVELTGRVDGQRRSVGTMWFIPDGGEPFEAGLIDAALIDQIARLSAEDVPAVATFHTRSRTGRSANALTRHAYSLVAIHEKADN